MNNQEAIERVIRDFRWSNHGLDEVARGLADFPNDQKWVAALAAAVAVQVNGDLHYDLEEQNQQNQAVSDLAVQAQRNGEQLDPARVLDIVGWPVGSGDQA